MLFAAFQMIRKSSNILITQFHVTSFSTRMMSDMWIPNKIKEQKMAN